MLIIKVQCVYHPAVWLDSSNRVCWWGEVSIFTIKQVFQLF